MQIECEAIKVLSMSPRGRKRNGSTDERAYGISLASSYGYAQHRRSMSASERNLNLARSRDSYCAQKGINKSPDLVCPNNNHRASPFHEKHTHVKGDALSNHRASLEKDIEQLHLRLQQERSMRMLLEKAMGRASSTLSPGHHHFTAQTKELIAEIELLEEEVVNREQHVLSLYRSIFENCVSRTTSEHSSVVTSPAHVNNDSRKHPSIISSAFCSSLKFPLQTFHSLSTTSDSRKKSILQSKARQASLHNGKDNSHWKKSCSIIQGQASNMSKPSAPRTLKDHLYQCPSRLSEEMVRNMAAVYCWLCSMPSANTEQNQSPFLNKSSTGFTLPRQDNGEKKDWSGRSTIEISWISTEKRNFSCASYAINNYRLLVEQLEKVNVRKMDTNAQIAFWINLYNSLVMHAYLAYGIPHNSLRRLALFHKAAYNVGGHVISASTIEQSIFCFRTPRIGQWLETVLSTAMRKRSGEERKLISSKFGLQNCPPLVCFALCTGAHSDPLLNVYTASNVEEELEAAKKEFVQANLAIKNSKKVFLPKLIEKYMKEACIPSHDLLKWVTENVDTKLSDTIQQCLDGRPNKRSSLIIKWLPFSSRFRYLFPKELTEKPW